jgi:aquaporin Z
MTGQNESASTPSRLSARQAFAQHWPLYIIEGVLLAGFMISACGFSILLEYPHAPGYAAIHSGFIRRALIGVAMGATAVGLIYSPIGKKSGAHMNPAFTLGFLWLQKIALWDALFYMVGQFIGGVLGVLFSRLVFGPALASPQIQWIVTVPGPQGAGAAWLGEFIISAILMGTVLLVNRSRTLSRFTGVFAGILIFLFVTFEAPYSGFSMNPARTVASALPSGIWTQWWIYFTAPVIGMLTAIEIHALAIRERHTLCPRFTHGGHSKHVLPCNCQYRVLQVLTKPTFMEASS